MPIAAAVVGAGASLIGGAMSSRAQSRAASQAASASQSATDQSIAEQRRMFDTIWGAGQSGRDAGDAATRRLSALSGLGGEDQTAALRATPGYQFNLDEGNRALNASLSSRGLSNSGAGVKAAIKYGQNYGDRILNNERGVLSGIAGIGQNAVNTGAQTGTTVVNNIQSALTGNARSLASSYDSRADASAGFWGTATGAVQSFATPKNMGALSKAFRGFR